MVKKKKHDKDKYYNLARQQGYRARSAFKLIQLNKKFDFLSKSKVCVDLCAAPGGWCQVAAKYMALSSIIIGIDLLPIRPIRNVRTFQCDITTAKCRQIIKQELQNWSADVVLCDGAPNVGAEYSKDAYVQNELALTAMKLAVEILGPGGVFVTKVFRSQDYNSLLWVFKQLFKKVSATKPLSSRNESAEIFVVCENFFAPHSIDPKLLDPKYVFSQLDLDNNNTKINIFHPKYNVQKRHREGYSDKLGITLTNKVSLGTFLETTDPIQLLTDATEIIISLDVSDNNNTLNKLENNNDDSANDNDTNNDGCRTNNIKQLNVQDQENKLKLIMNHPKTTPEIIECFKDLKVLGKSDFKSLLKWRIKILEEISKYDKKKITNNDESVEEENKSKDSIINENQDDIENKKEEYAKEELAQLRAKHDAKKKREKKKEREKKQKMRIRNAMGMDLLAIELPENDLTFTIKDLTKNDAILLDNCDEIIDSDVEDNEDNTLETKELIENDTSDDDKDINMLEEEMDEMYNLYLSKKNLKDETTSNCKRSKISKKAIADEVYVNDTIMYDGNNKEYLDMLQPENSDDSDLEENDEKLEVTFKPKETNIVETATRWFKNNELLREINEETTEVIQKLYSKVIQNDSITKNAKSCFQSNDDITKIMTDKEKRKEKRKKDKEKKDNRIKKLNIKNNNINDTNFDIIISSETNDVSTESTDTTNKVNINKEDIDTSIIKDKEKKKLIRLGMGNSIHNDKINDINNNDFEIVSKNSIDSNINVYDTRKYDSENEEYDENDHAHTMAMAHMILVGTKDKNNNITKGKDLIDASYNRYAWNDQPDLPDWLVDDEKKNYRPQIPINKDILLQMKERFISLASKPIKKVAEARNRKKKILLNKTKNAKRKANEIANISDMNTREKLKAIEKTMKTATIKKKNKVYVVSTRGGIKNSAMNKKTNKGKSVKLVDPRMKADKRGLESKKHSSKKKRRKN